MAHLLTVGNWLLPLLYLALMIDYGATFFLRTRTQTRSPWLWVVIAMHLALMALRTVHVGQLPPADPLGVLSAVALAMALVYAVVEFAGRDRRTGVFVIALAFLFQYTSSILLAGNLTAPAAREGAALIWSRLHIVPALVAYTALAFSAVYGVLYLVDRYDLRHRRFGVFFERLPPLDLLGTMMWHALLTGFVFMTLTILTGPMLFGSGEGAARAAMANPRILLKIIAGGAAWIIYAIAVAGRVLGKWSPARTAGIAVGGYAVVMALLVASAVL